MQQNTINCTHYFSTFQIFLTFIICEELFSTWQSVLWRISPPDNLSCGQISPHDRFFLHGHRPWCPWQIWGMFQICPISFVHSPQSPLPPVSHNKSPITQYSIILFGHSIQWCWWGMNGFDENNIHADEKWHNQLQPVHQKWSWPGNDRFLLAHSILQDEACLEWI